MNINYVHIIENSETCLNGHPVTMKTIDSKPWMCGNPSCELYDGKSIPDETDKILHGLWNRASIHAKQIGHTVNYEISSARHNLIQVQNTLLAEEVKKIQAFLEYPDNYESLDRNEKAIWVIECATKISTYCQKRLEELAPEDEIGLSSVTTFPPQNIVWEKGEIAPAPELKDLDIEI